VDISFATRALRSLCEDPSASSLQRATVEALRARIADVRAADSAADLLVSVVFDSSSTPGLIIKLSDACAIVCEVGHSQVPLDGQGSVAWERVRRIKVMSVGDQL